MQRALNLTKGVHGIYNKNDFAPEKREALDMLGAHVLEIVDGERGEALQASRGREG